MKGFNTKIQDDSIIWETLQNHNVFNIANNKTSNTI